MRKILLIFAVFALSLSSFSLHSQERVADRLLRAERFAFSTNILDWFDCLTLNLQFNYMINPNTSFVVKLRQNHWTFNKGKESQVQHRKMELQSGLRWWPWYYNSGWFFQGTAQYSKFNEGGLTSSLTYEGWATGLNLSAGYALMLSQHFNLEFGAACFAGWTKYTVYNCPKCGTIRYNRNKIMFFPDLNVSVVYIF